MKYTVTNHSIQRRPSSQKYQAGFLISFLRKVDALFELQDKPNGHYKIWAKGGKSAIVIKKNNRLILITFRRLEGNEDMQIRLISDKEMKMKAEEKAQKQANQRKKL